LKYSPEEWWNCVQHKIFHEKKKKVEEKEFDEFVNLKNRAFDDKF
jgi:hypothetical protein